MKVRKHFFVYTYHLVFIIILLRSVLRTDLADVKVINVVNVVLLLVFVFLAIKLLFNPYFIVIDGEDVMVAKSYYGYHKFKKSEIQSIEEAEGYTFNMHFKLKNGKKVIISSFDLAEKKRKELLDCLRRSE